MLLFRETYSICFYDRIIAHGLLCRIGIYIPSNDRKLFMRYIAFNYAHAAFGDAYVFTSSLGIHRRALIWEWSNQCFVSVLHRLVFSISRSVFSISRSIFSISS